MVRNVPGATRKTSRRGMAMSMLMEILIIIVIVGLATVYILKRVKESGL